jgi:hypothetical protein
MGVAILKKKYQKFKKLANESKYNSGLIDKLVCIFANMEERREEREKSLTLMQPIRPRLVTTC